VGLNLHTVMVTYNRLELTKQALASYFETTTGPFSLTVVDNGSSDGTEDFLRECLDWYDLEALMLHENKYPGYATNRGWEWAPDDTVLLHRADNDFIFLDGWENHVRMHFTANPNLGQLGLRTDDEELHNEHNVGGNNVIRKEVWDAGLRYDERTWPAISAKVPGYTEDSFLSPKVRKMGWEWGRVTVPCIQSISMESEDDPYYMQTWKDRGIR
jgi:glycosyltransferase involved in cell wall biosynthesis